MADESIRTAVAADTKLALPAKLSAILIYFFFSFHYFQFHKNNRSSISVLLLNTYSHPPPSSLNTMDHLLPELQDHPTHNPNNAFNLPPGFRFHPTDDELVTFYLLSKSFHNSPHPPSSFFFAEIDLCRCEPWDLPDYAKMGEREWYFYSLRDRKHPTRVRTNRATAAGYWKATGKDREVYSGVEKSIVGLKKTLVFYKGRAPRGVKTRWVMHEYRLHGCFSMPKLTPSPPPSLLLKEWVMCRIWLKAGEKGKNRCGMVVGEEERMEEKRVLLIPEMENCFVEEEVGGYEGLVAGWGLDGHSFWNGCGSSLSGVYYG